MGNKSSTEASLAIPAKMKRVVILEANGVLEETKFDVQEFDMPVPQSGEVLVRVSAAPVNPSDFGGWRTAKVDDPAKPFYLGKEGSGTVVSSGGGMLANGLVGKKVGIVNIKNGGSYQDYVVVSAMTGCFALADDTPVEDAASFFVNPYTAVGILATVREVGSPGFIHTAATSQLGQMIVKLCQKPQNHNLTLINVVRREDQAEILRALGATHIVDSSKEDWKDELAKLVKEHNISCAFDAISGEMTGDLVSVLPAKSTTFVYGGLSENPVSGIPALDLIYRQKKVQGFLLTHYLAEASGGDVGRLLRLNKMTKEVMPELANGWASSQYVDATPEEFWNKFLEMRKTSGFTNKKLRIRWPDPEVSVAAAEATTSAVPEAEAATAAPAQAATAATGATTVTAAPVEAATAAPAEGNKTAATEEK